MMKNRKQHPVLQRERVSLLPPRLQQLKTLLSHGPKTIDELVHGLVFDTKKPRDPVAIVRTYLSKLGNTYRCSSIFSMARVRMRFYLKNLKYPLTTFPKGIY